VHQERQVRHLPICPLNLSPLYSRLDEQRLVEGWDLRKRKKKIMARKSPKTERPPVERISREGSGSAEQRRKALEMAVSTIEKQFGKGAIVSMAQDGVNHEIPYFSSGSPSIDIALGIGGFPRGRVVEIYGPESSGKTTLTLHAIAEVQKTGGIAAFIDAEHALDVNYARRLGVKVEDLLVSQPDTGEQALEIADVLMRSGAIDIVVIDSVAALVPRAEIEGEMGDHHVGLQARLMSQALRKLTATVAKSGATIIFINQIRMKIGVMFGNPETTTGGNALKFYASIRIDVRRIAALKDGDEVVGNRTRVKVVKNKVAPPFRQAEFDIIYNEGISREGDLLDLGVDEGLVEKSGSWYSYDGERIGQGREKARQFLKDNPETCERLAESVYAAKGLKLPVPVGGHSAPLVPVADESDAEEAELED
jgi:recombination protein RecA